LIQIKYGPNPQKIIEVEVTPPRRTASSPSWRNSWEVIKEEQERRIWRIKAPKSKDSSPTPSKSKKIKKVWWVKTTSPSSTSFPGTDKSTSS
jgi:hypothetical protein